MIGALQDTENGDLELYLHGNPTVLLLQYC